MEYPPRIQRLLDKKNRTKSEDDYLRWYGAIGDGATIRYIIKEHNDSQQRDSLCTKQ